MAPPTILAHKSSFLTAQTLQLSQSLSPSPLWRSSNTATNTNTQTTTTEDGGTAAATALPERLVDEALYRANHILQQHARRVYAPQASRHVAEQIEALYLEAAERAVRGNDRIGGGDGEDEDEGTAVAKGKGDSEALFLRVGADFASDEVIASLPSTWDLHSPSQAESNPPEAQRYADLTATLTSLVARRRDARARLDRLRRMRTLLSPLTSMTPQSSNPVSSGSTRADPYEVGIEKVQPNLVTRDSELEKELERMRVLLVRVAGRVAQLPDPDPESVVMEDLDVVERDKVDRLLDDF
ncbi:kinetochore Sim4 complex subunit Fta4 [Hypoxylon trugodes]|uniref:kinetochore Sim4 complex subunit Fta4 n=1 Tax=Hypoxylon trugodes TaxID=326681 RepID=UPI00218F48FC|nr:kinetochore Sim4 complex subunit Fta4 [Hypoxylon trugodes]KAI1389319.1 kinetochore Sim4 complex subunit Fta4 [Hypoxylon trugodes]